MFDLARIARSRLVQHIDHHESLASTSDQALTMAARDDAPLPLLVLAERQTGGRGRGTNRWWSAEGALTFSLVRHAPPSVLPPDRWPQVALACGLAVCEALAELLPQADCRVKWPNDVFANGRKVCGILCESVPGWRDRLVIGIGINVNNSVEEEPGDVEGEKEFLNRAVAMVDLDGLSRDLSDVLLAVLDRLDYRWTLLTGQGFGSLTSAFRQQCFLTGKTIAVASGSERLIGRCTGIDDGGALVLQTQRGPRTIIAGSIEDWNHP